MRRLLILCEYPTLLGGERSMLATLPFVQQAGWQVEVAGPPSTLADAAHEIGADVVPWVVHDSYGKRRPLEALRKELAALLRDRRPHVVHANSLSMTRLSGPVMASERIASIGHVRDIVGLSQQAVADVNCHRRLIAVSHATRDFHVEQGADPAKCAVVHNGVDLDDFRPREGTGYLRVELRLSSTARFVATIGQIGLRKGTDVALDAIRRVLDEHTDVHWLVVGARTSGKDEAKQFAAGICEALVEEPLRERVHLLGTRNDVAHLMNECDVLLHAARQEPLGRVLLEAAASGVPVVATDVGGTREIFRGKQDGAILAATEDAAALARGLNLLLGVEARRKQLAAAARRRAVEQFDIVDAAKKLIQAYDECAPH